MRCAVNLIPYPLYPLERTLEPTEQKPGEAQTQPGNTGENFCVPAGFDIPIIQHVT
jgi:hypothetical protein